MAKPPNNRLGAITDHIKVAGVESIADPIGLGKAKEGDQKWSFKEKLPRTLHIFLGIFRGSLQLHQAPVPYDAAGAFRVVFVQNSLNQLHALEQLGKVFCERGATLFTLTQQKRIIRTRSDYFAEKSRVGFPFFKSLFALWRDRQGLKKILRTLPPGDKRHAEEIIVYYYVMRDIIESLRPDIIFISNDHLLIHRVACLAAYDVGVKTAYVQHAAVSDLFPPLAFDYAFLDGEVSKAIYENCDAKEISLGSIDVDTEIFKVGVMKGLSQTAPGDSVGIALPLHFPIEELKKLFQLISAEKYSLVVRTHPRENEEYVERVRLLADLNDLDAEIECGGLSSSEQFFSKCFCVVSRRSSILLEAALSDRPALDWSVRTEEGFDYYGFLKNNVVDHAESVEGVTRWLKNVMADGSADRIAEKRLYSESYKTDFQGKESEMVVGIVAKLFGREENGLTRIDG